MNPHFAVDRTSDTPLYRQIARRIRESIEAGRLSPGARLPTIRDLANDLSVTRVTVQTAFASLREGGWIESTVGRGTFVSETPPASRSRGLACNGWVEDAPRAGAAVSMAQAEPDPALAPARELFERLRELDHGPSWLARYGPIVGERSLREQLVRRLGERGLECGPDDLLITAGSTPALAALTHELARPGDRVLVEESTYFGFLALVESAGIEAVPVRMDEQGLDPEALERAVVRERPRFLYVQPSFHNPSGVTMGTARRREVLSVAERYGLRIVEDDVFHWLSYRDSVPRPLAAEAGDVEVVYVDSFSKCLLPGLRIGFVYVPRSLRQAVSSRLQAATLASSYLLQRALGEFLGDDGLESHLSQVLPVYRRRRDVLMAALERYLPTGCRWTRPEGGFCCSVQLPEGGDYAELERHATGSNVEFASGRIFDPRHRRVDRLRLCFGAIEAERIDSAIRRLASLIQGCAASEVRESRQEGGELPVV